MLAGLILLSLGQAANRSGAKAETENSFSCRDSDVKFPLSRESIIFLVFFGIYGGGG
jgi:hypothetical protein